MTNPNTVAGTVDYVHRESMSPGPDCGAKTIMEVTGMNHDYAHCADYDSKCPRSCFRGELVRDLRDNPRMIGIPVSWMHLKGTDECKLGDNGNGA